MCLHILYVNLFYIIYNVHDSYSYNKIELISIIYNYTYRYNIRIDKKIQI